MNKVIIISVRPQHAANILNGDKTLELRKSVPKDFVGWVYIYVTKCAPFYWMFFNKGKVVSVDSDENVILGESSVLVDSGYILNGSIVARFWFDCCEDFHNYIKWDRYGCPVEIPTPDNMYKKESLKKMCLTNR